MYHIQENIILLKFNNVITMGCRLNSWESNKINNFIRDDKKNDVMIFNSCCVTNDAVKSLKKNIKFEKKVDFDELYKKHFN